MSAGAPMVAIPAYHLALGRVQGWASGGHALPDAYVRAARRAGLRPVILPGPDPAPPEQVLAPFAGLLLAGGGDVDPARYGEPRDPHVYGVDPDRDSLELGLPSVALAMGLPVLAICRGMQVVNVACGGTLVQHLPDHVARGPHGDPSALTPATHAVRAEPGSRLAGAVGREVVEGCTSFHHQGVDRLGRGLVPTAWSDDGLVEALEPDDPEAWLLAVQWHPEMTADADPAQQAIFDAFADQVRRRAGPV